MGGDLPILTDFGRIRSMKTLFKKSISARELPIGWQTEGQFDPNERVTVCVQPDDPELAAAIVLGELMDVIGRRAQVRGLTEERLETILYEG